MSFSSIFDLYFITVPYVTVLYFIPALNLILKSTMHGTSVISLLVHHCCCRPLNTYIIVFLKTKTLNLTGEPYCLIYIQYNILILDGKTLHCWLEFHTEPEWHTKIIIISIKNVEAIHYIQYFVPWPAAYNPLTLSSLLPAGLENFHV